RVRVARKWTSIRVARPVFRFGRSSRTANSVYLSTLMLEEMESRAGIAPASAVLQTAACTARPTGCVKERASDSARPLCLRSICARLVLRLRRLAVFQRNEAGRHAENERVACILRRCKRLQ